MHTYVIFDSDPAIREHTIYEHIKLLHISPFDCVVPQSDGTSIGIAQTRLFIHALSLSPHEGDFTAGIITNAHTLTPEAQQSLLKTLEEPPIHAYIFLGAENDQQLLPTIRSRSITISHAEKFSGHNEEELSRVKHVLTQILAATPGERIRVVQAIGKSKEDIDHWIQVAVHILRSDILNGDLSREESQKKSSFIHRLLLARKHLSNNIQPILLIEHAVLHLS